MFTDSLEVACTSHKLLSSFAQILSSNSPSFPGIPTVNFKIFRTPMLVNYWGRGETFYKTFIETQECPNG